MGPTPGTPETLSEILVRRTNASPDADFLLTIADGGPHVEARTYRQVHSAAASLAATLTDVGVGEGDTVGCYFSNSPAWVVTSFAVWSLGATVAAVGTLQPGEEALRLLALAGVKANVREADSRLVSPDGIETVDVDFEGRVAGRRWMDGSYLLALPDPEATATIFFTSGTTGRPKGVRHSHRDLLSSGRKVAVAYARGDEYRPAAAPAHLAPGVIFNPFGHAAGYGRLSFRMWIGRPSLLVPKFSVPAIKSILTRFPVDSLQLSPTMVHMLATADRNLSLEGVRYVTSGTAPLSIVTRDMFEKRFGIPVIQAYGMTEVGTIAQERLEDALAGRRGPGSVGRIAQGVEVEIRSLDGNDPSEGRRDGEILVRHDRIPTDFVGGQSAPVDEEGWFSTGDVGFIDDHGILYITGRVGDRMIVGGFNVYPAEVEDTLRRSGLVRDAVVVGMADERLGERPVAGIVWDGPPQPDRLLEEIRAQLAHYKLPRQLFDLDAVPLTPRDKVDRRRVYELAEMALAGRSSPG